MVTYSYPPSEKPTINDGYSTQAFENSDVSKQMLRKVKSFSMMI